MRPPAGGDSREISLKREFQLIIQLFQLFLSGRISQLSLWQADLVGLLTDHHADTAYAYRCQNSL